MAQQPQQFVGKWKLVSAFPDHLKCMLSQFSTYIHSLQIESDNFENYMKEIGIGLVTRKAALVAKPTLEFSIKGTHWKASQITQLSEKSIKNSSSCCR
jgi:hypothetical protein